jgi:hypothetical protein
VVLKEDDVIKNRWKEYYNTLLNEENPRLPTEKSLPNQGLTHERGMGGNKENEK